MSSENILASNWNFARDFPQETEDQIDRPHFLETISGLLTATTIVFLEGEEGDGATTTLAQYCRRYPEQTFSLFIKPASRFAYSLDYLRLALTEQFHWYVFGTAFDKATVDQAEYMGLVYKVRKKKKNAILYIVIDGLHQIPQDDAFRIEEIFREVLPLGVDNFRFLIVGAQDEFSKYLGKTTSKPYQQLKFRLEEVEKFLNRPELSRDETSEIYKVCKGIPGRIASVKRLLNAGETLTDILEGEPSKYLEFIKLEFAAIDRLPEGAKLALAVITFAKRTLSRDEIIGISSALPDDFSSLENRCTFLNSPRQSGGSFSFVSESHRRFAEKKLIELQKQALLLQIDYLLKNPTSENALRFLPTYYQQLNQQQAIIDLITTDHYARLLQSTQSISALRNRADLAIKSANQLKAATEIFKFSLQQNILGAVGTQEVLNSEVDALVALNQTDRALKLSNEAMLREDRLRLLSTYCKGIKRKGGTVDTTIVDFIRKLAAEIDFGEQPDNAMEIAANILFFEPDLAIEIVEKANKRNQTSAKKDTELFSLSIAATLSDGSDNSGFTKKMGKLISDASLQKFIASLNAFTEQMPMSEVIGTAGLMDVEQRILFLRSVINVRRTHKDILDVVDYSLDMLIKEARYTPKARDLADFSIPLPQSKADDVRLARLIDRFDAQLGLISKSAASKYLVVLQMRLSHSQLHLNRSNAEERISQTYYDVSCIATPEVQAECFSIMLSMLERMDSDGALEAKNGFRAVIKGDLATVTDAILKHTADHFAATEGVLRSLIRSDHQAAFELACVLNSESRRNSALSLLASNIGKLPFSEERKACLFKSVNEISEYSDRDEAILGFHKAVEQNDERDLWVSICGTVREKATAMECVCECALIELRIKCENNTQTENDATTIYKLIEKVDSRLQAIDYAFTASAALAERDRRQAIIFFDHAQALKLQIIPNSERAKGTLERCIYLISRISQPIIKAGLFDDEALVRYSTLVEMLPCSTTQLMAFCDLAARSWCANRSDLTKRIMQEKCIPIVDAAKNSDINLYNNALRTCFPILRCVSSVKAFDFLAQLPKQLAEEALYEAALFIVRKITPYDPYHSYEFDKFILERDDLLELWSLIEKHNTDSGLYGTLSCVLDAVCSKTNKNVFTGQQRADLFQKLQQVINTKLPDQHNIKHDGYKIASLAQSLRLTDSSHKQWGILIDQANQIVNHADRAYVLIEIAKCMPGKYEADKQLLFASGVSAIDLIPSPIDRLSHYESFASASAKDATASAKAVLKRAILLSTELESSSKVQRHRRDLIDLAEKIEVGLADELVDLIDDDPARASVKRELALSANLSKVKRTLANAKSVTELEKTATDEFAQGAWKNFSALVAGRLEIRPIDVMIQYLLTIKGVPLERGYGMYMWYVENLCRKYNSGRDLEVHVLPLAEAIILSTEMAATILRLSRKQDVPINNEPSTATNAFVVLPGERERALDFIRTWLEANAEGYVKLCDAYFGPTDVAFLRLVIAAAPQCKVKILTSKSHLKSKSATTVDAFTDEWLQLCDQDPPETEVIALGSEGRDEILIHDRWLLTKGAGLRIGTSFNSLGLTKVSEISDMDAALAATHEANLDRYFEKHRTIDGTRMSYWSFAL